MNKPKVETNPTADILGGLFIGILSFVVFAGGILLAKMALDSFRFDKNCQATIGQRNPTYTRISRRFDVEYRVSYQFVIEGVVYDGTDEVEEPPLQMPVEVFYLPNDPSNNRLTRGDYWGELFGSVFAFAMSLLLFKAYRKVIGANEKRPCH